MYNRPWPLLGPVSKAKDAPVAHPEDTTYL
jgi:hypothetical protein